MREGSYTLPDGRKVQFTDADTFQLATDLYQYVEHDYKGSDSVDATRLEQIVKNLQAGMPLQASEWDILRELQDRLGAGFTAWRSGDRDGQGTSVPAGSGRIEEAMATLPASARVRIRENGGYQTDSTTTKDRQTTPPHLLDGALHDFAHAKQHADRLLAPDVKSNPSSVKFNHEHMMKHIVSGIDHLSRMGKHLEQHPSDPKVFQGERQVLKQLREAGELDSATVALMREHGDLPTVAVDFDGVVHQGPHGLPGKVEGTLVPDAAKGLKALAQGHRIVLLTARTDLDAVQVWLQAQGVMQYISDVTNIKPAAAAYIDDRAFHFENWRDAQSAIDPHVALTHSVKTVTVPDRSEQPSTFTTSPTK